MHKLKILTVEDDKAVSSLIMTALETHDYEYFLAENGEQALLEMSMHRPDLMILDLGLPDMDGVSIIRKVREWSGVPIIVVSARTDDSDKIEALDAGADDYLTKPFSVGELLARLRVALRRLPGDEDLQANVFLNGGLQIDYGARRVTVDDKEAFLTPIEYRLLCLLAHNIGKVLTHNFLLKNVWGNTLPADIPSLRVFMATLRKKIEPVSRKPKYIQTHVGVGYRMNKLDEEVVKDS